MIRTTTSGFTRRRSTALFLREAAQHFREVGAVAPSSASLAGALSSPLEVGASPRSVLEVGAGTGSVTAYSDSRVRVFDTRIELLRSDIEYDLIVSGLPFANFDPAHVWHLTS
ncbi:hypothetical protein ACNHUS_07660 [Actinomycetes bacterium M1A6_2h]